MASDRRVTSPMPCVDRHPDYLRNELVLNRDKCIAELQRDVSASKCENILISSEHFSYATTEDEWRKIHDAFSPLADTLKIVIYLRRQDTMAEAYWGQYVMLGRETRRFEDFRSRTGGRDYLRFSDQWQMFSGNPTSLSGPSSGSNSIKAMLLRTSWNRSVSGASRWRYVSPFSINHCRCPNSRRCG